MSYQSHILSLSPLLYIPFTETSGTTFSDLTGNGHDGSIIAHATAGAGDGFLCGQKAVHMDVGSSAYTQAIQIASPSTLPICDHAFSYEFWSRATAPFGASHLSIGNNTSVPGFGIGTPPVDNFFGYGATRVMEMTGGTAFNGTSNVARITFNNANYDTSTTTNDSQDVVNGFPLCWHYFCETFDGVSTLNYYVDGLPVTSIPIANFSFTPSFFVIGAGFASHVYFNHLSVYDYALTSSQIAGNYAAASPRCDNICFGIYKQTYQTQILD